MTMPRRGAALTLPPPPCRVEPRKISASPGDTVGTTESASGRTEMSWSKWLAVHSRVPTYSRAIVVSGHIQLTSYSRLPLGPCHMISEDRLVGKGWAVRLYFGGRLLIKKKQHK